MTTFDLEGFNEECESTADYILAAALRFTNDEPERDDEFEFNVCTMLALVVANCLGRSDHWPRKLGHVMGTAVDQLRKHGK